MDNSNRAKRIGHGVMLNFEPNMTLGEAKENYFNIFKIRENDHWMLVDDDEMEVDLTDNNKTLASYGIWCGFAIKAIPSATNEKWMDIISIKSI